MTPAHKRHPANATRCDVCRTRFIGARQLVTHLYYNPTHVRTVALAGAEADRQYRRVGR